MQFVNDYNKNTESLISAMLEIYPFGCLIFAYFGTIGGVYVGCNGYGDCFCCNCKKCDKMIACCCKISTTKKDESN